MLDSDNEYLQNFVANFKDDFLTNFINLVKSLYQYFRDLFKYAGGDGPVPEVEPIGY